MLRISAKAPAGDNGGALESVSCLAASDGPEPHPSPVAEHCRLGEKNLQLKRTRADAVLEILDERAVGTNFTLWLRSDVSLPSFSKELPNGRDHQLRLSIIRVAEKDPNVCNTLLRLLINERAP